MKMKSKKKIYNNINKGQNGTSHGHPGSCGNNVHIVHNIHNLHKVHNVHSDHNVHNVHTVQNVSMAQNMQNVSILYMRHCKPVHQSQSQNCAIFTSNIWSIL